MTLQLVVHYMMQGRTYCGMQAAYQNRWPRNHRWVTRGNEEDVTCPACRETLNQRASPKKSSR
jgi:hypothetical protein